MRRAFPVALGVLALAAVAAILAALLAGDPDGAGVIPAEPLTATATIDRPQHVFGDWLTATIDVVADNELVDVDAIVVGTRFSPFARVGPIERTRDDAGRTTHLRYVYPIQCVDRGCAPLEARDELELLPARVQYPAPSGVVTVTAPWPSLVVASRLRQDDVVDPSPQADLAALPAASTRVDPTVLGWLLGGAACVLVLASGIWLAWRLRVGSAAAPALEDEVADGRDELERALGLVERADGTAEQRRLALHALSGAVDDASLAADARRLAWSAAPPDIDRMRDLASSVRKGIAA